MVYRYLPLSVLLNTPSDQMVHVVLVINVMHTHTLACDLNNSTIFTGIHVNFNNFLMNLNT